MRGIFAYILICAIAFAVEELPVSIKGDSLVYQSNKIVASGNASISYSGYDISADYLEVNTSTNILSGYGRVLISQEGTETIPAESFDYDINAEQLNVEQVQLSFRPEVSKQDIILDFDNAKNFRDPRGTEYKDILNGKNCHLTTCDLDDPHYWLEAKKFLYYPGEKIVAYHVTGRFWFSPAPLFYSPYYVFSLGKRRVVFTFPKIGSNLVEGDFLKTETKYFIDDYNEGSIFVDAMSKKGNGKGFYHKYNFGDPGSIYYYNVREQDLRPKRDTNIVKWHQEYAPDSFSKYTLDHRYKKTYLLPTGFDDRMEDALSFQYKDGVDNAQVDYKYQEDYQTFLENQKLNSNIVAGQNTNRLSWQKDYRRPDQYRYEAFNLNHSYQINPELLYRVNPVYQRQKARSNPFDERMDLAMDLELTPQQKIYYQSMTVHTNWYYDLDADRVTVDNKSVDFVEKIPEVTVKALRYNVGGVTENEALFSVDSTYTSGLIRESKYFAAYDVRRLFESTKYSADITAFKTYDVGLGALTLARSYKQTGYGTRDSHYLLSDKPYFTTDWWGFMRNRIDYDDTRGEGNSPFFYDDPRISMVKRGNHKLSFYQRKQWEASISQAKDFQNIVFDDYLYNLGVDPWENEALRFNYNSGKNYYTNIYRDLVGSVTVHPWDKHYYRLSYTKDINNNFDDNPQAGKLKTASSEWDVYIGKTYEEMGYWSFWESEWRFLVKNVYDFNTEYYNLYSFGLGKDLHCWRMQYNFTPVRQEWYVVFSLKAFPEEPLSIHGNEDEEYSFEAFSDTIKAEPVRRYE